MSEDVYQRLIDALDALPNGFPRTPSGSEVLLIKKVFTPEEVELAGRMSRTYETVDKIANRAGLAKKKAIWGMHLTGPTPICCGWSEHQIW